MTRYALVPVTPDDETVKQVVVAMGQALASPARMKDGPINMIDSMRHVAEAGASALIAASPGQGAVTAEQLEAAAKASYRVINPDCAPERVDEHFEWYENGKSNPDSCVHYSAVALAYKHARANVCAIGLTVQP